MKTITIEGQLREDFGKENNRRLRHQGSVPGVIYGGDENIHFSARAIEFQDALFVPELCKINLKMDGKDDIEAIVKDVQYHPVTDKMLHIDLLQLVPGKAVTTTIPIKTEGKAPGVQEGGVLLTKVRKLKVKALPEKLQEFISVDISKLDINMTVKVKDLDKTMEGVEILNPDNAPVVTVVTPRALRSRSPMEALGVERAGEDIEYDQPETEEGEEGETAELEEGAEGSEGEGEEESKE